MDEIRVARYGVRITGLIIWTIIILVVAGPVLGAVTPGRIQQPIGLRADLSTLGPQLQVLFQGSGNLSEVHYLSVPIVNGWVFPATVTITLGLLAQGILVYRTPMASEDLAPFTTGVIKVEVQVPKSVLTEISGTSVSLIGNVTLGAPSDLLSVRVEIGSGGPSR